MADDNILQWCRHKRMQEATLDLHENSVTLVNGVVLASKLQLIFWNCMKTVTN